MTEQAIPQNITLYQQHLLSVSPIEFKRNSSLIEYHNNNIIDDEILDLEKAESRNELSFNDISGLDDKKVHFSFTSPKVSRGNSFLNKSHKSLHKNTLPAIGVTEASFLEYSSDEIDINSNYGKIFEKNNKVINTKKHIYFLMLNKQKIFFKIDLSSKTSLDCLSNSDSSIQFQSFSLSESMVVSPIAHEMSQINGQELKDVSDLSHEFV